MRTALWIFLVIILVGWLAERETGQGVFQNGESLMRNWVAANAGLPDPAPAPVVFLDVRTAGDDLFGPTDWSALGYAMVLQSVGSAQARALGIAQPPNQTGPGWREMESMVVGRAVQVPRLVWGIELGQEYEPEDSLPPLAVLRRVEGNTERLFEFRGVQGSPPESVLWTGAAGVVNFPRRTSLPTLHRIPLVFRCGGHVVAGFPLQMLVAGKGLTLEDVRFHTRHGLEFPDGTTIPLDRDGCLQILPGIQSAVSKFSLEDVLIGEGELGSQLLDGKPGEALKDRAVVVGNSGRESYRLSSGESLASAEILALATAQLYAGWTPGPVPHLAAIGVLMGWGILLTALVMLVRRSKLIWVALASLVYLLGAVGLCQQSMLWIPMIPALLMALTAWIGIRLLPA